MNQRPFGTRTRNTYYLLVAFSLLVIIVNLQIARSAHKMLETDERSAAELDRLEAVEQSADTLYAVGHTVRDGGDLRTASSELRSEWPRYRAAFQKSLRDVRGDHQLGADLDQIDRSLLQSFRETENLIRLTAADRLENTSAVMNQLHRYEITFRKRIGNARIALRQRQVEHFREEALHSRSLARQQAVSGALMALLVVGLVVYGRHLNRAVTTSGEREQYLQLLEEREVALRSALGERDARAEDLRHSEERFQLASRATDDLIWDWDLATGELHRIRHGVQEMRMQHLGELADDLGSRLEEAGIHPDDALRVGTGLYEVVNSAATTWKCEYRFHDAAKGWRDVLERAYIVRDASAKAVRMIGAMTDITDRRAVERLKDEFVATVSHELRTPLTSIRGALGLLTSGRLGSLPEKGQRLLEIASTNTDRLVRLINDILDIERMESGKVTLMKTDCEAADLAGHAADIVRPLADRESIRIVLDTPAVRLVADSDRMIQVLTNLLGNAVKFSPPGSIITLTVHSDGPNVTFAIADQGRGIPPEKLDTIFERFQQVDASDARDKGGSGLGLPICRTIVQQHGGSVTVESELGGGSKFSVTIPGAVRPGLPEAASSKLIYVCDDDSDTREVIHYMLAARGYRVRSLPSGEDLLRDVIAHRPDAILLDLFMPDMNGWETLARLRNDTAIADVPVIIISVLSSDETGESGLDFSGWVQKPLDEMTLAAVVKQAFRKTDRKPRLMLVEDDTDLASIIGASFERYGIETIHARDGREAISIAQRIDPDLLILDLALPGVDGYGVIDWLKDHDLWRSVPLVVYSASEPTPSQRERLQLGYTEFITKSRVTPEEFEKRIMTLLDTLTHHTGSITDVA